MANTIDPSLYLSNNQTKTRKTGTDILGKDDFLKILMVQLQNQDPANPMEDKDFIAQMATFSTLEQITNMNSSIKKLVATQEESNLISFNQFIGKEVTWHKVKVSEDKDKEPTIEEGTGTVVSITFKDGTVIMKLEDGTTIEPANISQVNGASKDNSLAQASMLIGKTITYLNDKKEEMTAVVKSVLFKNGKTLFQLADGTTTITASQITKIE